MRTLKLALAGALLVASALTAAAHGGGTDKNGCHHDRKSGGYHCH
ncbi:YHYH domain-containing protein [Agrobacterium cavarae]